MLKFDHHSIITFSSQFTHDYHYFYINNTSKYKHIYKHNTFHDFDFNIYTPTCIYDTIKVYFSIILRHNFREEL